MVAPVVRHDEAVGSIPTSSTEFSIEGFFAWAAAEWASSLSWAVHNCVGRHACDVPWFGPHVVLLGYLAYTTLYDFLMS
jgi:hypothetical protein